MKFLVIVLLALVLAACTASSTSVQETPTTEGRERTEHSGGANPNTNHRGKTPAQLMQGR